MPKREQRDCVVNTANLKPETSKLKQVVEYLKGKQETQQKTHKF